MQPYWGVVYAPPTPEAVTGYNRTISYAYDSLYRLTGAVYTEGATVNEYLYGYDLRGNRTSVTAPGVGTFTYTYNLANQIGGFSYDLNGNLISDGHLTYTYDAANRLRKVIRGAETLEYAYTGNGDRYAHTLTQGTEITSVNYLLDPSGALSRVLSETIDTPTADWTNVYLYGLGILGQQNGSTWSTFGTDPLGSVRFLLDNTGEIASRADYDPYGVPLSVPGQESGMDTALGFTGEQTDPLGLVNLRARTYNPQLGAFTSVDPVLGVGGSTGWNGYLYANANPANLTDPAGTCTEAAQNAGFFQCIGYDIFNTLAQVFYALPDVYSNAPRYFADGLKDTWKDGLSGWWSGLQESLPHVWAFTFEVALPMFWEPADWISGIVNGDPLALLPLVPSAARFASHASDPLRIGRKVVDAVDTPRDLDSRGRVIVDRMTDESPGRSLAKRRRWYSPSEDLIEVSHYTSRRDALSMLSDGEISVKPIGDGEAYVYVMRGRSSPIDAADAGAKSVEARLVFKAKAAEIELDPAQRMRMTGKEHGRVITDAQVFRRPGTIYLEGRDAIVEIPTLFGRWRWRAIR